MLLDKSGLRKRAKDEEEDNKNKGGKLNDGKGFKQTAKKPKTAQEVHDQAVQMALKFGIGYDQYKKEVDAIRAAQIRERLEKAHKD